jgi:hypothetical protein
MQKAYLVPKNAANGNERPTRSAHSMEPINKMDGSLLVCFSRARQFNSGCRDNRYPGYCI